MMDHYQQIKEARKTIKEKVFELCRISNALSIVGHDTLSVIISTIAADINQAEVEIGNAVSGKINDDYKNMMTDIGKTLSVMAKEGEIE